MTAFWAAFRESTVIQGAIALVVVGGLVGRLFQCGQVDGELIGLAGTVVGFYFGSKLTKSAMRDGKGDGG